MMKLPTSTETILPNQIKPVNLTPEFMTCGLYHDSMESCMVKLPLTHTYRMEIADNWQGPVLGARSYSQRKIVMTLQTNTIGPLNPMFHLRLEGP